MARCVFMITKNSRFRATEKNDQQSVLKNSGVYGWELVEHKNSRLSTEFNWFKLQDEQMLSKFLYNLYYMQVALVDVIF